MRCDYCDERKGIKTVYNKIYGEQNRTVFETEHFSVFPCMGQLREGHLLIASKEHTNAIGMLDEKSIKELESLISVISKFFRKEYAKNLLCFEHGVLGDEGTNGGCGIYHMHIHLVPVECCEFVAVLGQVKSQKTNTAYLVQGLMDTCCCVKAQKTYVFISQIDEEQKQESYIVNNSNNYFESQYMRKIICNVFGKAVWDWKKIRNKEPEFLRTLEKSKAFFHG